MRTRTLPLMLALTIATAIVPALAQSTVVAPVAATAATVVPTLVRYSGVALRSDGKAQTGDTSVTFLIYKDEKRGEPLWVETQTVAFDPGGHYSIYLGAMSASGLPAELFGTGEARWLEVQVAGAAPQPRVLLTSVPYALKAADAATLGGLPASAFALAGSAVSGAITSTTSAAVTPDSSSTVITTGGSTHYLPKFTGATTIANSEIYDTGTSVGIGVVPNPSARLDVGGGIILRGGMTVSRTGNATSSQAYPSWPFQFYSNVYNSSTKATDNPHFELQSEPVGNNTPYTGATFNLLYSNLGAAPAETGLSINSSGIINFASGQYFNSNASSGVSISGINNVGTGVSGTSQAGDGVYGSTAGSTLDTAGILGIAGSRDTSGFSGIAGVWGDASAHVGVLGTSDQYAGVQGISTKGDGVDGTSTSNTGVRGVSTSGTGVAGTSTTANGMLGYTFGGTLNTAGVLGGAGGPSGYGGIAGVWGDAYAHIGVLGSSSQASAVVGTSSSGMGVQGVSASNDGVYGSTSDANANDRVAGVYGYATGVLPGVRADNDGTTGPAAVFSNRSTSEPTIVGVNYSGTSNAGSVAIYGDGASSSSIGVEGNTLSGIGVYAAANAQSTGFQLSGFVGPVALWADSTENGIGGGIAVRATANGNSAGYFTNNSQYSTIYSYNYGSGNTGTDAVGPFGALQAETPKGSCGIGGSGDLTCTGQVKTLATTGGGTRKVETYSMQSPENWMEDFGSATLEHGAATVSIDPAFAETVSVNADYHVFLTPNGDSRGLYVVAKTANSFVVRESGGGASTLSFDYRIVAKRRGYEGERMVDVTEAVQAAHNRAAEQLKTTAPTRVAALEPKHPPRR